MKTFLRISFIFFLTTQICYGQLEFLNKQIVQRSFFDQKSEVLKANIDSLMLDSIITDYRESELIPGIAALIMKDDKIIWNKNYGYRNLEQQLPVEDSTLFLMASISKTFLATAVMQLWEKGLIDLEADINNYLPGGFTITNPYHPGEKITVKTLMTHSSSLVDNWNILDALNVCGDSPIGIDSFLINYFTPDRPYYSVANFSSYHVAQVYNYSNAASCLLALMIENITGKSFNDYTKDSIFIPLSMLSTSWFLKELDVDKIAIPYENILPTCHLGFPFYPIGGLRTNKLDLANFVSAYIHSGTFKSMKILDNSTINLMLSDQLGFLNTYGENQGLIWFNAPPISLDTWGHTGGYYGCSTAMYLNREENWGIILFHNKYVHNEKYWSTIYSMGNYAHLYGNIYANSFQTIFGYVRKNLDSLLFTAQFSNMNDHQFTAHLIYNNSDKTLIDSVLLYDDGTHGDTYSQDGIYGTYIPPQSTENFFKIGVSTVDHQTGKYFVTDNLSQFTTAGPPIVDSIMYVHIPAQKRYSFRPYLHNTGSTLPISNVSMKIICNDPWVTNFTGTNVTFPAIQPGSRVQSSSTSAIYYDPTFPGYFNFKFEIASDNYVYWYDSLKLVVTPTVVENNNLISTEYALDQNFPNPFNPSTKISWQSPVGSHQTLKVYDVLGNEVATLVDEYKPAGTYEVEFNPASSIQHLASGIYFYQLRAGEYTSVKKMIYLK